VSSTLLEGEIQLRTSALGLSAKIDPCLSHDLLFASIVTWFSYGTPPKVARLKPA